MNANIRSGQIWRENDSRMERFIKIIRVTVYVIHFRTCNLDGDFKSGTRESSDLRERFGEKRGYRYVRETA